MSVFLQNDNLTDFNSNTFLYTDGSDFVGRTSTLSFPSGSRNASLTVIILDDNVVEMPETFVCELSASEDLLELGFTLDAAASIVNIMDNDGEYASVHECFSGWRIKGEGGGNVRT